MSSKPQLDLAFKEGQTIKVTFTPKSLSLEQRFLSQVNINIPKSDKSRPRAKGGAGLLPPPPGGVGAIKPPPAAAPGASSLTPLSSPISNSVDLLGGLDLSNLSLQQQPPSNLPPPASTQSKYEVDHFSFSNHDVFTGQMTPGVPLRVRKLVTERFQKSGLASKCHR